MSDQQDRLEQDLRRLGELAAARRSVSDEVMRRVRVLPVPAQPARAIRWRVWAPLAAAAVLIVTGTMWWSADRRPRLGVRVSELTGTVLINAEGARQWLPVQEGRGLRRGDRLHVMPNSRARLLLPDGSWVALEPGSLVTLARAGQRIEVCLSSGRIHAASDRPHASLLVVRTPWAQIEPTGTDFGVQVD
jgi:ferric-dicitrate binding protein FerR (iron transport regulator)